MARAEPPSLNEVEKEVLPPGNDSRSGTQSSLGEERSASGRRCVDHGTGSRVFDHRQRVNVIASDRVVMATKRNPVSFQPGCEESPGPRPRHRDHRAGAARPQRRTGYLVDAGRFGHQTRTRLAILGNRLRVGRHRRSPVSASARSRPPAAAAILAPAAGTAADFILSDREGGEICAIHG